MPLHVAYLINQYPAVSHTFIKREIHALERRGVTVQRIALRGWDAELVDDSDRRERELTSYVLNENVGRFMSAVLSTAVRSPARMWTALRLAIKLGRRSDRPAVVHLVYVAEACVILQYLVRSGAQHLHAHFATNPAEIAMLVRVLGGPPYSFTAHGSDIVDSPAQMGFAQKVGLSAFVATVCAFGRSQIQRWVPHTSWDRLEIVRCGLEPGYAADYAAAAPHSDRLVCVGRLSKEKGQLLLIEAAAQVAASGRRFELVLAGDGPMRAEIEALIAARGLRECVRIAGWLDSRAVQAELQQARALVVPSLSEGLPVVIMEAFAHGKPVVAPFLGGIPELVAPGRTGWLYPASDSQALAQAMRSCLDADWSELDAMALACRRSVWAAHDVDAEAGKLLALFSRSGTPQTSGLNPGST
jgi:colanic acid/amylovoran biosynthesis glycosyltransferase